MPTFSEQPSLVELNLILIQFDMNSPELKAGLIKVLDKQSPTLRKLDLSGNLIKDDLVNALAYASNLRLT